MGARSQLPQQYDEVGDPDSSSGYEISRPHDYKQFAMRPGSADDSDEFYDSGQRPKYAYSTYGSPMPDGESALRRRRPRNAPVGVRSQKYPPRLQQIPQQFDDDEDEDGDNFGAANGNDNSRSHDQERRFSQLNDANDSSQRPKYAYSTYGDRSSVVQSLKRPVRSQQMPQQYDQTEDGMDLEQNLDITSSPRRDQPRLGVSDSSQRPKYAYSTYGGSRSPELSQDHPSQPKQVLQPYDDDGHDSQATNDVDSPSSHSNRRPRQPEGVDDSAPRPKYVYSMYGDAKSPVSTDKLRCAATTHGEPRRPSLHGAGAAPPGSVEVYSTSVAKKSVPERTSVKPMYNEYTWSDSDDSIIDETTYQPRSRSHRSDFGRLPEEPGPQYRYSTYGDREVDEPDPDVTELRGAVITDDYKYNAWNRRREPEGGFEADEDECVPSPQKESPPAKDAKRPRRRWADPAPTAVSALPSAKTAPKRAGQGKKKGQPPIRPHDSRSSEYLKSQCTRCAPT